MTDCVRRQASNVERFPDFTNTRAVIPRFATHQASPAGLAKPTTARPPLARVRTFTGGADVFDGREAFDADSNGGTAAGARIAP